MLPWPPRVNSQSFTEEYEKLRDPECMPCTIFISFFRSTDIIHRLTSSWITLICTDYGSIVQDEVLASIGPINNLVIPQCRQILMRSQLAPTAAACTNAFLIHGGAATFTHLLKKRYSIDIGAESVVKWWHAIRKLFQIYRNDNISTT